MPAAPTVPSFSLSSNERETVPAPTKPSFLLEPNERETVPAWTFERESKSSHPTISLFALASNERQTVSAAHTNLFALELNERESVPVPPTEESELPPPPKKLKGLFHRRKSIGRRKDGRQKKTGSYDYADVRVSHGLNSTARSQEVLSAVVGTRGEGSTAIVPTPLKTELQRDLKKAIASNLKYAASTECLKKENEIQKKKYPRRRRK